MYKNFAIQLFLLLISGYDLFPQQKLIKPADINQMVKTLKKDIREVTISDQYVSNGIQHIYINESIKGIPIVNSTGSLHIGLFGTKLEDKGIYGGLHKFNINVQESFNEMVALDKVIKGKKLDKKPYSIQFSGLILGKNSGKKLKANGISDQDALVEKKIFYDEKTKKLNLFWEVTLDETANNDLRQYWVDAKSGVIIKEQSLKLQCHFGDHQGHQHGQKEFKSHKSDNLPESSMSDSSYFVYAWPIESPNFGSPSLIRKPDTIGRLASPNGWHKIGSINHVTTKGNNVDCYEDTDDTNVPTFGDNSRASGGTSLTFNYPINHNLAPSVSQKASIVNTFYWSNIIHDVLYQYGFDEASGNFQQANFGAQGSPNDILLAEVQDGSGTCNANFATPPDGLSPRMQMYNCGIRDGGFDNGVIAHEIGHGLSIRLTGGPSNVNCLNNTEQMGEGWSDFLGIILTIKPGDTRFTQRPMGTWLFEQGPGGGGIRPYPYSTDMAVNPMTYNTIKQANISVPHGVGSVWATILWEMTWDLIDAYGFDPNIYHGTGGNNLALRLVIEAMKLQPCSPGFVDGRDAIFLADKLLYNDAHLCTLQKSFAKRGLGYGAIQGSSNDRIDGVESFLPFPDCFIDVQFIPSRDSVRASDTIAYKVKIKNNITNVVDSIRTTNPILKDFTYISANKSPQVTSNAVSWKFNNVPALGSDSATVLYKMGYDDQGFFIYQTFNGPIQNFTSSTNGASSWSLINSTRPNEGLEYFAPNVPTVSRTILEFSPPEPVGTGFKLSFDHRYLLETWWDYAVIEISENGGQTWENYIDLFTSNGYNGNSRGGFAFTGSSNGYIRSVMDLSRYLGKTIKIRFILDSDASVAQLGWYIDNVSFGKDSNILRPKLQIQTQGVSWEINASKPVFIVPEDFFKIQVNQVTCLGANDAFIKVSGNTRSIDSIVWNTGQKDTLINGIQSGNYTAKIYSGGKVYCIYRTIIPYDTLRSSILSYNQEGSSPGSATITVNGGTPPYQINWSNGQSGNSILNLTAGMYIATITDAKGCVLKDTVKIINTLNCPLDYRPFRIEIQSDQYPYEISYAIQDENGLLLESGSNITQIGGRDTIYLCIPPSSCYKFTIYDSYGDGLCASYSTPQGYYRIYDTNNNTLIKEGCNYGSVDTFNLCSVQSLRITGRQINHESCSGINDGSINITAAGGTGQLSYSWQGVTSTSNSVNNLQPKQYILTISDQTNNSIMDTIRIYSKRVGVITSAVDGNPGSFRSEYNKVCAPDTMMISKYLHLDTLNFNLGQTLISRNTIVLQENNLKTYFFRANHTTNLFNISNLGTLRLNKVTLGTTHQTHSQPLIFNQGNLFLTTTNLYFSPSSGSIPAINNQGQMNLTGINKIIKTIVSD